MNKLDFSFESEINRRKEEYLTVHDFKIVVTTWNINGKEINEPIDDLLKTASYTNDIDVKLIYIQQG